ncbi:MAG: hypothetical protein ACOX2L_09785 [Anaerolineae bacterium]|jgi:hypothetical protein|nr:hypothetical protein [Chloroflexota bacterium]
MPYPTFDRSQLRLLPLAERIHDMQLDEVLPLDAPPLRDYQGTELQTLADRVIAARRASRPVILMMGAHMIKVGLSRFIVDLIARGMVTHIACNGAFAIHDYELAAIGATTESVARYISSGQFGLWNETGYLNDVVREGLTQEMGAGEAIGRWIAESPFPHSDLSVLAAAWRAGIPATIHVGIGNDIIHEHPNCDGAAWGAASYRDFLVFTHTVTQLQGGVFLNYGTAVMGPEVYLKALSMARNVAHQRGEQINIFTTAVFDLQDLGPDVHHTPDKSQAAYYFRPFKTILVRTVQDGGESYYVRADHRTTLPILYRLICAGWEAEAPAHG